MRLTVLALPLAFLSVVAAHGDAHNHPRDVDELSTRDILEDISTRELLDALSDRLDRRGAPKFQPYNCAFCHKYVASQDHDAQYGCKLSTSGGHGRPDGKKYTGWFP